nr:unnamed protein product [Callosobruchus analis]
MQHRKTLLQFTKTTFYYNTFCSQISTVQILLKSDNVSVWSHKPWSKSITRSSKDLCSAT